MIVDKSIDNGKAFDWGRTSKEYAKFRDIYPDKFYQKIVKRNLCIKGQKVLDLGTGTGVLPRNMYKYGAEWTGSDISENQIVEAVHLSKENNMNIWSKVKKISFKNYMKLVYMKNQKELNDNIQDLKNENQKLTSLNGEYSQKIKELKSELQELKNNNKKNNENENENKAFGYKKLISVMNIGGGNEENEANEKKLEDNRPSVDRSNNGRDINSNLKNKENEQNKIFNFENEYD